MSAGKKEIQDQLCALENDLRRALERRDFGVAEMIRPMIRASKKHLSDRYGETAAFVKRETHGGMR